MTKSAIAHTTITKSHRATEGILVGVRGPNTGREYVLVGQEIRLGRGEDCDIVLNDINASRHHAVIRNQHGNYQIVDLQSKNKTFVNDQAVQQCRLQHKDLIQIGESTFRFHTSRQNSPVAQAKVAATNQRRSSSRADFHYNLASQKAWKIPNLPSLKLPGTGNSKAIARILLMIAVVLLGILVAMSLFKSPAKSSGKTAQHKKNNSQPIVHVASEGHVAPEGKTPPYNTNVKTVSQTIKSGDDSKNNSQRSISNLSLAREHYSQGMQALDVGDYKRAISLFESVVSNDPTHPIATQKIKQAKQRLNDQIQEYYNNGLREYSKLYFERAIVEWQKTAALSADYLPDYFDKANNKISEAKTKLLESR